MILYQIVEFNDLIEGERYFIRYGQYQWIIGKLQKIDVYPTFCNLKKNSSWQYRGIKWIIEL